MSSNPTRTQRKTVSTSLAERGGQSHDATRSADWFLGEIHRLVRAGTIRRAQQLAREAASLYPENPEVQTASRLFVEGQTNTRPRTGRSLRDEYRWLKSPPDKYRGRWVALIGDQVVAVADSLAKLRELLPPHLDRTPLAVQVAP